VSGSARACPAIRPISYPVPSSPTRTAPSPLITIKVIDQQNLYLLSRNCLLLSLARRGRTGLARSSRISGSNTGTLGCCKPALAGLQQPAAFCVFPGGYSVDGHRGDRRDVSRHAP